VNSNYGDDIQIIALLRGDQADIAAALNWIDKIYRLKISGKLRQRFPQLPSSDLPEIWQTTLLAIYEKANQRKFGSEGSLAALLYTIAVRRAWDRLRRFMAWKHLMEAMVATEGEYVRYECERRAEDLLEQNELLKSIRDSISDLPPRQNFVWQVYLKHLPRSLDMEFLTKKVRQELKASPADKQKVTKKVVTSALYAGRDKVRRKLIDRGYEL
jgi:DNA-directed RNA polymerase specialized sigma24 family protein